MLLAQLRLTSVQYVLHFKHAAYNECLCDIHILCTQLSLLMCHSAAQTLLLSRLVARVSACSVLSAANACADVIDFLSVVVDMLVTQTSNIFGCNAVVEPVEVQHLL
ncbi:TPA: hypothetical protein ACH3X2_004894 [Trebouxia sp. C0005]